MRILFASAEVAPFARTGGLGDVCGALPKALRELGHEVVVFCPFYGDVRRWCDEHGIDLESIGGETLDWNGLSGELEALRTTLPGSEVPICFIRNDALFDREGLYWGREDGTDDNLERFTFFCRAVVATAARLGGTFDVVHAHDWQTALLPIYLHAGLSRTAPFARARSVYTIHNLNYQGRYGADRFEVLGLPPGYMSSEALEYFGDVVLMKGGIVFADRVTTVSPTYAREIQTSEFGAGLDGLLRASASKLAGILNGIDVAEWDPATDPLIPARFDAGDLAGKALCRKALRKESALDPIPRTPLLCAISRLVDQKGLDLFIPMIPGLVAAGWQIAVLGTGEWELEERLRRAAAEHPGRVAVWSRFDTALSHRLIAGSDAILIPSRYEPCGLNQMYALRYGTIPLVRATGGLIDTVEPWDGSNDRSATGFAFGRADSEALWQMLLLARLGFRDRTLWSRMQRSGMARDFSWDASAREYDRLYRGLASP